MRYAAIGGAFGGREDLSMQHLLALATWKLRRPSRMVWSREESIIGHHKRHPLQHPLPLGREARRHDRRGRDRGVRRRRRLCVDERRGDQVRDALRAPALRVPNVAVDGYAVYTNNVPSGAFRGFGAPQAHSPPRSMVTRLAHALEIDPADSAARTLPRGQHRADRNAAAGRRQRPPGARALHRARRARGYDAARATRPHGHASPGVGIACGIKNVGYSFGFPEQSTATVELIGDVEHRARRVRIGAADVGQGAHLILRQIAAEALGAAARSRWRW